jgi:hypothetical protein
MIDLGYPPYFATILGTAKILAAATLLTPGILASRNGPTLEFSST